MMESFCLYVCLIVYSILHVDHSENRLAPCQKKKNRLAGLGLFLSWTAHSSPVHSQAAACPAPSSSTGHLRSPAAPPLSYRSESTPPPPRRRRRRSTMAAFLARQAAQALRARQTVRSLTSPHLPYPPSRILPISSLILRPSLAVPWCWCCYVCLIPCRRCFCRRSLGRPRRRCRGTYGPT
jgi:hypothetical protein